MGAASNLDNAGETLTLTNPAGLTVFSVTWSDAPPWPGEADGLGRSLVPVDPDATSTPPLAPGWRTSSQPEGSPGVDDPAPPAPTVYINEVLSNALAPDTDRIELYNPNPVAVDVSHWWISDSNSLLQKFRIPPGTVIPAGGFLVFSESDFNTGVSAFAFSSTGENAVLSGGDAGGALTGYSTSLSFGPAEPGVSFGRYLNSRGTAFFTAQAQATFGAANAAPLVGPVVLSELLYWPVAGNDEFVELRNISTQPVPLFDPANPANVWRVDGIGFSFPPGVTLAPGQIVLVVPINPETFRTKYNIPAATAIYGPATASLRNEGEQITLQKPGPPWLDGTGLTVVPFIEVDRVDYSPLAPWPVSAGGPNGISLERLNAHAFGDDPANWRAATGPGEHLRPPRCPDLGPVVRPAFHPAAAGRSRHRHGRGRLRLRRSHQRRGMGLWHLSLAARGDPHHGEHGPGGSGSAPPADHPPQPQRHRAHPAGGHLCQSELLVSQRSAPHWHAGRSGRRNGIHQLPAIPRRSPTSPGNSSGCASCPIRR